METACADVVVVPNTDDAACDNPVSERMAADAASNEGNILERL